MEGLPPISPDRWTLLLLSYQKVTLLKFSVFSKMSDKFQKEWDILWTEEIGYINQIFVLKSTIFRKSKAHDCLGFKDGTDDGHSFCVLFYGRQENHFERTQFSNCAELFKLFKNAPFRNHCRLWISDKYSTMAWLQYIIRLAGELSEM